MIDNCGCEQEPCIPCNDDTKCIQKIDAECVVYHIDDDKPSKLTCLGIPNKTTLEAIIEAIDTKICNATTLQTPLTVIDTDSVDLTSTGIAGHTLQADVKISADLGNSIEVRPTGLYSPGGDGKLKVDATDTLDYLGDQVIGGTDGVVTISVSVVGGKLVIIPTLNIPALLDLIESNNLTQFCALVAECDNPPLSCGIPTNLTASIN